MERSGNLADGSVERLLAWAAKERFYGRMELTAPDAVMFFSNGFIAHIAVAGDEVGVPDTKPEGHVLYAGRLATLSSTRGGSYTIIDSRELPDEARWLFGPQVLMDAARADRAPDVLPARPATPSSEPVRLAPASPMGEVRLSGDAWRVVSAMSRPVLAEVLGDRLGWDEARIRSAVEELQWGRLLAGPPAPPVIVLDEAPPPSVQAPVASPPPARSAPPSKPAFVRAATPPRPQPARTVAPRAAAPRDAESLAEEPSGGRTRASALRRLIHSLK